MTQQAGANAHAMRSMHPEKQTLRIGYLPLADCASLVMASKLGLDEKYGIKIELSREMSWAGVRDKLHNGELDAAHVLYGLVYGVQMGIGGQQRDMAVLMNLNHSGQPSPCRRRWRARAPTMAPHWRGICAVRRGPLRLHILSRPATTRCCCNTGWPRMASIRCATRA